MTSTSAPPVDPPLASRSTTLPTGSPRPGVGTISDLTQRATQAAERDREAIQQVASVQMRRLTADLAIELSAHASTLTKHVTAELYTTERAIGAHLHRIHSSTRLSRRLVLTWIAWPLIATVAVSLLMVIAATAFSADRLYGIPATTTTNKKGQPMQVLTGTEWTTCTWQGRKHPCRTAPK